MTSPFPPFAGSSPFPFPFPSISPFPLVGTTPNPNPSNLFSTTNTGPPTGNPNPFGSSPFSFNPRSGGISGGISGSGNGNASGLTPSFPHTLSHLSFNTLPSQSNLDALGGSQAAPKRDGNGVEDLGKSLNDLGILVDRATNALKEITRVQGGLWTTSEIRGEGLEMGMGGLTKLELLYLEYNQILQALLTLSQTSLIGALPVPLSSAIQNPQQQLDEAATTAVGIDDLGIWAEQRANIEFNRREAVKSSSKAILDVLKQSSR